MRTFCMGDTHGNYKGLLQCLERSGFDKEKDTLIQLGDICDGWGETSECVDELLTIKNLIAIRGNHDVWCYDWFKWGLTPILWTEQGGKATMESYVRTGNIASHSHRKFWENQIDWYIDDQNRLFIHAGWAYKEADFPESANYKVNAGTIAKECHWDRSLINNAISTKIFIEKDVPEYNKKIQKALGEFKEVYIGHTAMNGEPKNYLNLWNLDTGSGWYGVLTIMNIDTKEYWQSDSSRELYPNEKGRG